MILSTPKIGRWDARGMFHIIRVAECKEMTGFALTMCNQLIPRDEPNGDCVEDVNAEHLCTKCWPFGVDEP